MIEKKIECPICDGIAELKIEKKLHDFRKEQFEIFEYYYQCDKCGETFSTTESDELTFITLYNLYRSKNNIPFPEQLTKLREQYEISASLFSKILGFGVNQYANYEKGEVPNESNATLLSLVSEPEEFRKILVRKKDLLKEKQYQKLLEIVNKLIHKKQELGWVNVGIDNPSPALSEFNGFTAPSNEKFANMVLFFLEVAPNKTRLNKLLFYADFLNFKYTGKSISGSEYAAINFGPVPNRYLSKFEALIRNSYINITVEYDNEREWEKLISHKKFDKTIFSEEEIAVLNEVKKHFAAMKTKKIVEISHNEVGWKNNSEKKGLISYTKYATSIKAL